MPPLALHPQLRKGRDNYGGDLKVKGVPVGAAKRSTAPHYPRVARLLDRNLASHSDPAPMLEDRSPSYIENEEGAFFIALKELALSQASVGRTMKSRNNTF